MERVFHVISNTHWDREWRYPYQRNRQMLVDMIDSVLDILENEPEYRAFHLDSQTIVLNDYLQIKPDKKDLITKFIKEKRLLVGPWYILPEEFQVGGENLIRNLLLGHKTAIKYGRVSKVGYSPFSWGQISQLPQIYAGFEINLIMFYRGVNSLDSKKAEFLWVGADGTKAITSRFSTMPRYNFYFYIYRPVVHNQFFADVEYLWEKGGLPFHFCDKKLHNEDYFIAKPKDEYFPENIEKQVTAIIENQVDDFTTPHVIWMEGHDSSGPNKKTVQIIKDIKDKFPNLNVIHSTLEDYSELLINSVEVDKLTVVKGERRSAQYDLRSGNMYGYTTSARMYLKQMNFDAERWLQFYAEPFNMFAGILGKDIKDEYINIAWELIIQNSAHDSIGGCSLDEIHEDMITRYKQAIEISKGVFERAVKYIATKINTNKIYLNSSLSNSIKLYDVNLAVINPTNQNRNEIIKVFLDIPKKYEVKNPNFIDSEGNICKFISLSKISTLPVVEQMIDRPLYMDMSTYEGFLEVSNIPQFGIKTLKLINKNETDVDLSNICDCEKLPCLENANLKVTINKNGTFNLLKKDNNIIYNNLGYFLDEGEEGHAWTNVPFEPILDTLDSKPNIEVLTNNPFYGSIKITHNLAIPLNYEDRKKNIFNGNLKIELIISLLKHSKRIELEVIVNNIAESHRLRLMMPTNLDAAFSYGEGQFDVVERSLERPDTFNWVEQPMYDYPMHQFMDLSNNNNGLAVLVDGLKEYEVLNDDDKTIAITLFRAFRFIIQPSSKQDYTYQKGAQCLGLNKYKLAVYPHDGNWEKGNVYNEALNYNMPVSVVQIGDNDGDLSDNINFLKIEPESIQFSALKKSEENLDNDYVLRLFNPTETNQNCTIQFLNNIQSACLVTLEEIFIRPLEITDNNIINTSLDAKKILTVKIKFYK
ncbi:MAG: glycoside hydrolase family 38 C-terminal domain-containing protein [bacterium]